MSQYMNSLGKSNQLKLKNIFGYKTIAKAKTDFNVNSAEQAYEVMRTMYNERIKQEEDDLAREEIRKYTEKLKKKTTKKEDKKVAKKELKKLMKLGYKLDIDIIPPRHRTIIVGGETTLKVLKKMTIENINNLLGDRSFNLIKSFIHTLTRAFNEYKMYKYWFNVKVMYQKELVDVEGNPMIEPLETNHHIKAIRILRRDEIIPSINENIERLRELIDKFETKGSGWNFIKIVSVDLFITKYQPIKGGSYIDLPDNIKNKHCCHNIQNKDVLCAKYCLLLHFNKDKIKSHHERVKQYAQFDNQFDFSKISFPVSLKDISKLEKIVNKPINVFGCEKNPLRISERVQETDEINLLLISKGDNNHYVYIKDINVFLTRGVQEGEISTSNKRFYCKRCIHGFTTQELLSKHLTNGCLQIEPTKSVLPTIKDGVIPAISFSDKFSKRYKQFWCPFTIYADFESFIIAMMEQILLDNTKSYTKQIQKHEACGFAFKVVSEYPEFDFPMVSYRGEDAGKHFVDSILDMEDTLMKILQRNIPIIITDEQENEFQNANNCIFCDKELKTDRVRDHDHITGLYRGASHNKCNINYNFKNFKIPVFFHNLKNYDGHIIIKALNDKGFENIQIIAQNFEKYISFSFSHLKFLDSFSFLTSSLDTLVKNLAEEGQDKFKYVFEGITDPIQKQLLLKKGTYPYDYMTGMNVFEETGLPSQDKFYSKLSESGISDADYLHAQNVWNTFGIQNMGEYHDLYLKTDVGLLADVFENFRKIAMRDYGLDPANYYTLPNYSWDCMLKKTGVVLEQITDIDMYQMIEQGLRGGISVISHRYAKANNKYVDGYDETKPSSYITCQDANNLYGGAMVEALPTGDFRFDALVDENKNEAINADGDADEGFILKIDLDYPNKIHDAHNDYPLAAERVAVENDMLSDYAKSLKKNMNMKGAIVEKLVPNLNSKKNYVIHYRNLQYYLKKGMVITKWHSILRFKQSKWLEPYIMFNTDKRAQAKNAFEKDFYKLMNNAVFGKTMENVRNRVDIRLINTEKQFTKLASKPTFESCEVFDTNLIGVLMKKTKTILDKPIYAGFAILELSKLHMYNFHYEFIKEKYGDKAKLLMTDTDSLTYHIETEDLYKDMNENKELFDFSGYNKDHFCYDNTNNKVLGKFKDETNGIPIVEFIGLRSKMYSMKLSNEKAKMTGKGIKRQALINKIQHSDYKRCLFGTERQDKQQLISFNLIRSSKHQLYTYSLNKVGLCNYDDKRYLLEDGVSSYAYGHYKTI